MYFQVPQFIDIEDKIFGPLTFKQFIYVLGGGAAAFVLIKLLPDFIAIIISAPIVVFALALAFYKVNNRPFIDIVQSWINYKLGTKLYTWKHREVTEDIQKKDRVTSTTSVSAIPNVSQSKLKEMTWSLDILDSKPKDTNQ
jgi:hypothetical protein